MSDFDKLKQDLIATDSSSEVKDIIDLFNLNLKKKDIVRATKYSEILDKIADHLSDRVDKVPDQFTNKELIESIKTLQAVLDNTANTTAEKLPIIQVVDNSTNLVSNGMELGVESRHRIRDAVEAILKSSTGTVIDIDNIEEIEEDLQDEILQREPEETV